MSKPYDQNFIEDYQEQPEREYYDHQLESAEEREIDKSESHVSFLPDKENSA